MTEGMHIYQRFWDSLGHQVSGGDICFLGGAYLLFGFFGWRKDLHIDFYGFSTHRVGMGWPVGLFFFEMAMKSQELMSVSRES